MPSRVADIYLRLGDVQARAAEGKRALWGQALSNLTQLPGQILGARQQQQREQRRIEHDDAMLALERAKAARAEGDYQRADREFKRSQQLHELQSQVLQAATSKDPNTWDADAATQAAASVSNTMPDLAPDVMGWARDQNLKFNPPPVFHPAGSVGVSPTTGQPVPGAKIPEKITYGAPQPMMIGGKRTMVRAGSDDKLYDMQGKPVDAAIEPDQPPMTPYQGATLGIQRERLAAEKAKTAQAEADKTELTPEGLDAAALMFSKTGVLPALGMGDKTTRKAIINRAAALVPGLDIASAKADYGANTATLTQLEKQRAAIGAFEQTASKNIDIFLQTAGKVVDTGSPLANTLLRQASGSLLGSPDQAQYDAARQVVVNEVAKIITNPNLSGQLSDAARHEVASFNPTGATLKQTVALMRLLKRDMANRTDALDDQIRAIRARIKQGAPGSPTTPSADPLGLFGPKK